MITHWVFYTSKCLTKSRKQTEKEGIRYLKIRTQTASCGLCV